MKIIILFLVSLSMIYGQTVETNLSGRAENARRASEGLTLKSGRSATSQQQVVSGSNAPARSKFLTPAEAYAYYCEHVVPRHFAVEPTPIPSPAVTAKKLLSMEVR